MRLRISRVFARLTLDKGIFELLRAWKIVKDALLNARLRIMGSFVSERYRAEFFRFMRKLNLRNAEFLGFVNDRDKLYRLVSETKVLIYPSYQDVVPLTVLRLHPLVMPLLLMAFQPLGGFMVACLMFVL